MIESKDNQKFKSWMKLKLKKYRDETNLFLVYGKTMVDLALSHGVVTEVITTNEQIEGTLINEKLMKELSQTETTFDQMAVCKKLNQTMQSNYILVLDDVQNPDNVGALLRSAVAFGYKHIVLSLKSADLYNEKTIRASQGAIFDCFVERRNIIDFMMEYSDKGYQIFGADAHQSTNQPEQNKPLILVLGNEGNGLSSDVKDLVDGLVQIKTETVESLNVVVAGSILMYEWGKRS